MCKYKFRVSTSFQGQLHFYSLISKFAVLKITSLMSITNFWETVCVHACIWVGGCGVFYIVFNILHYVSLNDTVIGEWIWKKKCGKKWLWPNQGTILVFAWRECGKQKQIAVWRASVWTKIQTEHFPNTSPEQSLLDKGNFSIHKK